MESELLSNYEQASAWTLEHVKGATEQMEAPTPDDDWDVRALLNHMLDTSRYFVNAARGDDATLPAAPPPDLISDNPIADFERARRDTIDTFSQPGVIEKTMPSLGIAFSDQLLHGWDLAVATGQDARMPDGLAEAAYEMIHGRFTP
ncbi:MAG: maleylpyruvate isomerase family mycothiol-dependent enzyme, partial [Acidimicrobiia bacterium]